LNADDKLDIAFNGPILLFEVCTPKAGERNASPAGKKFQRVHFLVLPLIAAIVVVSCAVGVGTVTKRLR